LGEEKERAGRPNRPGWRAAPPFPSSPGEHAAPGKSLAKSSEFPPARPALAKPPEAGRVGD